MAFSLSDRKIIFERAGGRCEKCGKQIVFGNHQPGDRGAWQAHHRTSVASGGDNTPSNGIALCLDCHTDTYTYGKRL